MGISANGSTRMRIGWRCPSVEVNIRCGVSSLIPEAAHPAKRDGAPLRLVSWLSCHLDSNAQTLIDEAMKEFSNVEAVPSDKILQMGRFHLP